MATKGKDPLVTALREIEKYAPACSRDAVAVTEATEAEGLDVITWRGAARRIQSIARKALREAGHDV